MRTNRSTRNTTQSTRGSRIGCQNIPTERLSRVERKYYEHWIKEEEKCTRKLTSQTFQAKSWPPFCQLPPPNTEWQYLDSISNAPTSPNKHHFCAKNLSIQSARLCAFHTLHLAGLVCFLLMSPAVSVHSLYSCLLLDVFRTRAFWKCAICVPDLQAHRLRKLFIFFKRILMEAWTFIHDIISLLHCFFLHGPNKERFSHSRFI